MARTTGPQCKQCRREGMKLFLKGERCRTEKGSGERRSYPPGQHGPGRPGGAAKKRGSSRPRGGKKRRPRRYYGVPEKQFATYYEKASRKSGITGFELLRLLEVRLDNVVYRLGFASSRAQARQLVRH